MNMQAQMQAKSTSVHAPSFIPVQRKQLQQREAPDNVSTKPGRGYDFSRVQIHPALPGILQTKLTVNKPGDMYEQEADRVAEQVMRMPATSEDPNRQTPCLECKEELRRQPMEDEEEEDEEALQAKELPGQTPTVTSALQGRINSIKGGGQPLATSTRAFMEPRFGHDFSQVRVHTDSQAAETARAVNARAYTLGRDIVFGVRQYAPETGEGRRLLAHELTHVMQQERAIIEAQTALTLSTPNDSGGHEAKAVTDHITTDVESEPTYHITKQSRMIQRDINYDLFIKGENYWFPNQGLARIAALNRATSLGPGHTIKHHPSPLIGQPHYHIIDSRQKQVAGHFFYGPHPPIKEREKSRYRERAKENQEIKSEERKSRALTVEPTIIELAPAMRSDRQKLQEELYRKIGPVPSSLSERNKYPSFCGCE